MQIFCLCCLESELERVIRVSADKFTDNDLENLSSCYDEDLIVEIAGKYKLRLPEESSWYVVVLCKVWKL